MPEVNNHNLSLQAKIFELKKKLAVEQKMYEASKHIQAALGQKSNAQQVENSLKDTVNRIEFIEGQILEVEKQLNRTVSNSTEYLDAIEELSISSNPSKTPLRSASTATITNRTAQAPRQNIDLYLAGKRLSDAKITHKICDLSCRLKINENILEAETKMIEAFNGQGSSNDKDLREKRELTKQRVQLLGKSLKKYTSLKCDLVYSNPTSPIVNDDSASILTGPEIQFTGKLFIKITRIGGIIGRDFSSPFKINLNLDQWSVSGSSSKKSNTISELIACSKDTEDSSAYNCYQEVSVSLMRATELEISVFSGGSNSVHGLIFFKLADLLVSGPDDQVALSETFEIEPAGFINLQLQFSNRTNSLIINIISSR